MNDVMDNEFVPVPMQAPEAPVVKLRKDGTPDLRTGKKSTVLPDGTISYGFKADGSAKSRPGRKPKAVQLNDAWRGNSTPLLSQQENLKC